MREKLEQFLWLMSKDMKEGDSLTLTMVLTKTDGKVHRRIVPNPQATQPKNGAE